MKRIISILCIACAVLGAQASDFCRKNADGKIIYYNITTQKGGKPTVSVTFFQEGDAFTYKDTLNVPETVTRKEVTYTVTAVGKRAFYYSNSLQVVNLPKTVTKIEDEAFKMSTVQAVNGTLNVETVGIEAFYSTQVKSIELPALKKLGKMAFFECDLKHFDIGSNLERIEEGTFNFSKEYRVKLPATLKYVGKKAFDAQRMADVYCLGTVPPKCEPNSFCEKLSDLRSLVLHVPAGSRSAYENAPVWQDFGTIVDIKE